MNKTARLIRSRPLRRERDPGNRPGDRLELLRGWMQEGLHSLPRESTVLALGCEEAFLGPHLAEYSADVTVLDSSAAQIAQLSRRFPEISFLPHDPANALPFPHRTFDAIWCCEYLDRVFDPAAALRDMHRVLAPGGRLLLTVPDHSGVGHALGVLFRRSEPPSHAGPRIQQFTGRSLATLARAAGFIGVQIGRSSAGRNGRDDVPSRMLLLSAQKDPAVPQSSAARPGEKETAMDLAEQLAYAGRGPAVGV